MRGNDAKKDIKNDRKANKPAEDIKEKNRQ